MLEVCNIGVVVVQYYLSWIKTREEETCKGSLSPKTWWCYEILPKYFMLEVGNIGVVVVQYFLSWLQTTEGVTCRGLVNVGNQTVTPIEYIGLVALQK